MRRIVGLVVACVLAASFSVCALAQDTLQLRDLVNRADRWPETVTLNKGFNFAGGMSAQAGQEVRVVEFDGRQVTVDAGGGLVFSVTPNDCDLIEAANAAWAALTPEQRAVDVQSLVGNPALWPLRVAIGTDLQMNDGTKIEAGSEFALVGLDRNGLTIHQPETNMRTTLAHAHTDVIRRARERALLPEGERPSRIVEALRGAVVDESGDRVADEAFEDAMLFALYYTASWCGPCRAFSPTLIEYVKGVAADNPGLVVLTMSSDRDEAAMYTYMKESGMPWHAVPMVDMHARPVLHSFAGGSIPHLAIVDRHGRILGNSVQNGRYVGTQPPMNALKKHVSEGMAKGRG